MKTIYFVALAIAVPFTMAHAQSNSSKTFGKSTYKIIGNYVGTGKNGLYYEYDSPDSIRTYAKIADDTLFITQEMYKKSALIRAKYTKVNYKHAKIKITKPDNDFNNFKIGISTDYDKTNNSYVTYLSTHDFTSNSNSTIAYLYFSSGDKAEAFYSNLKSGTSTTSANTAQSTAADKQDDSKKELKVELRNKSSNKVLICYEKSPGSRDLSYNTINAGSTITIFSKAGCNVYSVKEGSKEKQGVLLQISESMNNTEQVIAK